MKNHDDSNVWISNYSKIIDKVQSVFILQEDLKCPPYGKFDNDCKGNIQQKKLLKDKDNKE